MARIIYGRPGADEKERLNEILAESFHAPVDYWDAWAERVGRENLRVLRRGKSVLAGLGIHRFGQWYLGRLVPMGGVAAVGVAPEARGTGVAMDLLVRALRDMREEGVAVSTLYASTQALYRKVGYEHGGSCVTWRIPAAGLPRGPRDLPVRPVPAGDIGLLAPLRTRWAAGEHGQTERPESFWAGLHPAGERALAYLFGRKKSPEGYLHFHQTRLPEGGYDLRVRDLVALTPAARRRIWTFLADHRSLARTVRFHGAPADPNLLLFPEATWRVEESLRFMLRIVDVPAALEARGWPPDGEGELHLRVEDPVVPQNDGRFRLRVAGGRAEVRPGGEGTFALSVGALAPLFSGLVRAGDLRGLGMLSASDGEILDAERLFASPAPWMADRF